MYEYYQNWLKKEKIWVVQLIIREKNVKVDIYFLKDTRTDNLVSELDQTFQQKIILMLCVLFQTKAKKGKNNTDIKSEKAHIHTHTPKTSRLVIFINANIFT